MSTEEALAVVLALPRKDRAELAAHLLESLDEPTQSEWEASWVVECERRLEEVRAGRMSERPAEEVFAAARERAAARARRG